MIPMKKVIQRINPSHWLDGSDWSGDLINADDELFCMTTQICHSCPSTPLRINSSRNPDTGLDFMTHLFEKPDHIPLLLHFNVGTDPRSVLLGFDRKTQIQVIALNILSRELQH